MTRMQSFSKKENELLPKFRKMINESESTEDVKKFFVYSMQDLFTQVFAGAIELRYEDISLLPEEVPSFAISARIRSREDFTEVWKASDLSQIVARFAGLAAGHYKRIAKNPPKTEAKIRM
jgi:hypothetical protein